MRASAGSALDAVRRWIGRPWRAQATVTYVIVVVVTTLILRSTSPHVNLVLLRSSSTNLHRLRQDPVSVLVTSAMWVPTGQYQFYALALLVLAPVEQWVGTLRWLATFVAGHVGSTAVVAIGLSIGVQAGWTDPSVSRAVDVGPSYGVYALVGLCAYRVPRRFRIVFAVVLLGYLTVALAVGRTFTDWGHLCSAAIGLGLGRVLDADGEAALTART